MPAFTPRTDATLLVCCDDRPGLVAALAQALYGLGTNILDADQHTDAVAGKFFQRIRFDYSELAGASQSAEGSEPAEGSESAEGSEPSLATARPPSLHRLEAAIGLVAERHAMRWSLHYGAVPKRVAIFVSRTDHCLYDLLLRHRAGELACEIPLIVSNHEKLRPVAEQFDIPYQCLPVTPETKREVEEKEIALLREQRIDLVVLARYMQILSEDFTAAFASRIINIHHSFLPAFAGGRPYHQAYDRGVKRIGATAHYATGDLDEGPIIEQDVIRVSHRDLPADLVRKGRDVERTVLSRAVRYHVEDRVLVYDNKTVVFDG
jgi:formyltetrahydrofolate deformylase